MKTTFNLIRVMDKYGLRQIDLARAADISPVTINNYCRGNAYPSVPSLIAMSDNLDIPIEDFFETEEKGNAILRCPKCHAPISVKLEIAK